MGRKLESGVPQLTSPGHITVIGPGYAGYWDSSGRWHGIGGGRIPDSTRQQAENIFSMYNVDPEDWERQKELLALQNKYRLQQIGAAGEASRGGGSVAAVRPARF